MDNFDLIAFLCGHFSAANKLNEIPQGWEADIISDDIRKTYLGYYYPEIVDFSFGNGSANFKSITKKIDKQVEITVKNNGELVPKAINIKEATIYFLPYDIALYSIHIEAKSNDLNDFTAITSTLRNIFFINSENILPFIDAAIKPIISIYELLTGKKVDSSEQLVENGNKFKLFQIINAHGKDFQINNKTLVGLATQSQIKANSKESLFTDSYTENLLKDAQISVYENWTALALFDSYTMLGKDIPGWMLSYWKEDYFRIIYIHGLFRQIYLFNLNKSYRQGSKKITALENELSEFKRRYWFPTISYNFLPNLIYEKISHGLNLDKQRSQLYEVISLENSCYEKKSNSRMNTLLLFITIVTISSAVWDVCCLLDNTIGFSVDNFSKRNILYIISSVTLYLVIATISWLILRRQTKGSDKGSNQK